jgi:hypothetical protein
MLGHAVETRVRRCAAIPYCYYLLRLESADFYNCCPRPRPRPHPHPHCRSVRRLSPVWDEEQDNIDSAAKRAGPVQAISQLALLRATTWGPCASSRPAAGRRGQRAGDRSTAHDANEQQRGVTASDGECESAAGAWTSRTGCALDARGTRRRAGMQRVDQIHSCSCLYRPGTQTLDDAWHASSSSSASLSCSLLCLVLPARLGFSSLPATALLCSARLCSARLCSALHAAASPSAARCQA